MTSLQKWSQLGYPFTTLFNIALWHWDKNFITTRGNTMTTLLFLLLLWGWKQAKSSVVNSAFTMACTTFTRWTCMSEMILFIWLCIPFLQRWGTNYCHRFPDISGNLHDMVTSVETPNPRKFPDCNHSISYHYLSPVPPLTFPSFFQASRKCIYFSL